MDRKYVIITKNVKERYNEYRPANTRPLAKIEKGK